ncbi:uncharacterized protein PAC_01581 [Phialocephala subalpina]|uniref:F-box domain-containing protein n=1 Tax=Phialocephala subalpina TaxID=576137 RepID=A0A1L7WG05_9HELO|nr:uncharacterized protein PAC_01581 [Phialocephala subalpina]
MGLVEIFCAICGCPLQGVEYDPDALPKEGTKWLKEFRVIGKTNFSVRISHGTSELNFNISALGSIPAGNGPYVDIEDTNGVSNAWRLGSGYGPWQVYEADEIGTVLFPIHTACLSIIQHALSWRKHQTPSASSVMTMEDFYKVLCQQHERNSVATETMSPETAAAFGLQGLEWEHGYYGARQFWSQEWESEDQWEWLCADPIKIPTLTSDILSRLNPLPRESHSATQETALFSHTRITSQHSPTPFLEELPTEVLDHITSFLQTSSIIYLRRCSKTLAARLPIGQKFWREQILSGRLVGYLWDLDYDQCRQLALEEDEGMANKAWDWNRLAKSLMRDYFNEPDLELSKGYTAEWQARLENMNLKCKGDWVPGSIGLINRRRIWKIVQNMKL